MIRAGKLNKLTTAFPKSLVAIPRFDKSYFFDSEGATIGMLDWCLEEFYLHTNYVHYDLAKKSLKDNMIPFKEKEIDVAELVYGQPKDEH